MAQRSHGPPGDSEVVIIPEQVTAKVVSLKRNIRKWVTYAAAACILLIVSSTSYFYVQTHSGKIESGPSIEQRLASLNERDIINYLKDDQETTGDIIPASNEQEIEIQHLLQNTSDQEILNYLDDSNTLNEKNIKGI